MSAAAHRIRRLRFTVSAGGQEEAFRIRSGLRALLPAILERLEAVFDNLAGPAETITIPRLEIAVPLTDMDDLSRRVGVEMQRLLAERQAPRTTGPDGDDRQGWRARSAEEAGYGGLLHYLRTGSLPWQDCHRDPGDTALRFTMIIRLQWRRLLGDLVAMDAGPVVLFRLLQHLDYDQTATLAATFAESSGAVPMVRILLSSGRLHLHRGEILAILAELLRQDPAPQAGGSTEVADLCHHLTTSLPPATLPGFLAFCRASSIPLSEPPVEKDAASTAPPPSPASGPGTTTGGTQTDSPDTKGRADGRDTQPRTARPRHRHPAARPLPVRHAGLVLLHPFLPRLFRRTGLLAPSAPGKLTDPAAAARLLHFLATGGGEIYEFELPLVKVLIGLTPASPLPLCGEEASPAIRGEAEALLASVIEHWTALKNTSIPGLRASFLQRPGLLDEEEPGWRLRPEHASYDMLLDRLPWSTAIVRLPWMDKPLCTEWPTTH
ncbi:MAG: contractile injection system tape measure protein [Thermodesulfobacteriota bacterium]